MVGARLRRPCANEPSSTSGSPARGCAPRTRWPPVRPARCRAGRTGRGRRRRRPASRSSHPGLEGELAHVPVRQPAAAFVVAHEPVIGATVREPVPPDHGLAGRSRDASASSPPSPAAGPRPSWRRRGARRRPSCRTGSPAAGSVGGRLRIAADGRSRRVSTRRRRRRTGSRGRCDVRTTRCSCPVSPTARRAALMRLVSADSLTKRSPHTVSRSSFLGHQTGAVAHEERPARRTPGVPPETVRLASQLVPARGRARSRRRSRSPRRACQGVLRGRRGTGHGGAARRIDCARRQRRPPWHREGRPR